MQPEPPGRGVMLLYQGGQLLGGRLGCLAIPGAGLQSEAQGRDQVGNERSAGARVCRWEEQAGRAERSRELGGLEAEQRHIGVQLQVLLGQGGRSPEALTVLVCLQRTDLRSLLTPLGLGVLPCKGRATGTLSLGPRMGPTHTGAGVIANDSQPPHPPASKAQRPPEA